MIGAVFGSLADVYPSAKEKNVSLKKELIMLKKGTILPSNHNAKTLEKTIHDEGSPPHWKCISRRSRNLLEESLPPPIHQFFLHLF